MRVSQSVKFAGVGLLALILYFLVRAVFNQSAPVIADPEQQLFSVAVTEITPSSWQDEITIRGRTEAIRKVAVRAETAGAIAETPAQEGAFVETGDPLCVIEIDARRAALSEARAAVNKAKLDHDAAAKLGEGGFRSPTSVATAKAALDLATANLERATVELEKTKITAPFDGIFDRRNAEVGDFLGIGDPCGVVIQQSPFLVVGAVSENDVAKIAVGDIGIAELATGETLEGRVRYVGAAADESTRTFDVELEVPNTDGMLRDGVTAEFRVFAKRRNAHLVPRSALSIGDSGDIGVKTVADGGQVFFNKVALLGESPNGVWVSGLDGMNTLIVRGQDFVRAGQIVEPVSLNDVTADSAQ